jgi:hypothetical protein
MRFATAKTVASNPNPPLIRAAADALFHLCSAAKINYFFHSTPFLRVLPQIQFIGMHLIYAAAHANVKLRRE